MSSHLRRMVLILLLIGLFALPSRAAQPVLRSPDRRGVLMLVAKGTDLNKFGTGVVVGPSTILTAKHVVGGTMEIALLNGKRLPGRTVCRSREEDLAVVRATLPRGTPQYVLSSRTPRVGEPVRVGGYPNRQWTVASGRVTHVITSAVLGGRRIRSPMIVFTPALHQGASGSPVLNRRGDVVGIFVASNRRENYSIAFPAATALRACGGFLR
ncbi:MAG TPA: serine protease [bacterium]|nr:serine protease [bacterium]